ncbi:Uncharacterized protein QTN25_000857 [Entamoeba marina]
MLLTETLKRKTCNCGKDVHNDGTMTWMYGFHISISQYISISSLNTEIDLLMTTGSQINYVYCLDFIENMGAAFPQYTCPCLMLMISAMANNNGNEEEAMIIHNQNPTIADYCVGHPNTLPPTIQYTSCDKQIVQSISNESGICPCGKMHIVNGKEYDYAFVLNNKLVGVDLNKSLMHNCQRICVELGLDKGLIVVVYVAIYDSLMDLMNKTLYNDYFYHGSSCVKKDNSKVLKLNGLYLLNCMQPSDRYYSFYSLFENMIERKKTNYRDNPYTLKSVMKEIIKEYGVKPGYENEIEDQNSTPGVTSNIFFEEDECTKAITSMYEEKGNSLKILWNQCLDIDCRSDNNLLPKGSPELEPNQVNSMSSDNLDEGIEQNKDEEKQKDIENVQKLNENIEVDEEKQNESAQIVNEEIEKVNEDLQETSKIKQKLTEETHQSDVIEQKQQEPKMVEIKEINETEQMTNRSESPLFTNQMKQQQTPSTNYHFNEDLFSNGNDDWCFSLKRNPNNKGRSKFGTLSDYKQNDDLDEKTQQHLAMLNYLKSLGNGKSPNMFEFEQFKEKPKGHTLREDVDDCMDDCVSVDPVEYTPPETTKKIRVRTKYQTLTIGVNDSTTIRDVVGHVNFCTKKSGKEPYNGKLNQPRSKEDLMQNLNSTLASLGLFNTMLTYM